MWSLVASLSSNDVQLDSSAVLGDKRVLVEPGSTRYRWQVPDSSLFAVAGLPKDGNARLSIYLVQDESSTGRILCFASTLRMRELRCDYPPQMTADALCSRPRRQSIRFKDAPSSLPPKGHLLDCCSETHGTDARFHINYTADLRYGAKGQVQVQLNILSVELRVSCYQVLEAYFRRPEGHRLVMECNDQYVGGPQCLEKYPVTTQREGESPRGSAYVYQWLTTTKRPPTPRMTKEELYDVAMIEGEEEEEEGKNSRGSSLGVLMSPRTRYSNVKTPRPDSHVRKQELVPPPFVPDSPEKHNETRRLYAAVGQGQRVRFQLFNFRFTPPRRLIHVLSYTDFTAAYGRTLAKYKIQSGEPPPPETMGSPRLKLFRRSSRKRNSKREERARQQEIEKEQMTCRLERDIAENILLVVQFSFSERQTMVFMRKVELLVQDARKTLNF